MSLYFWLMLGTLLGPFLLSFDRKVHFYTHWRILFPSTLIVALAYVAWDELYTSWGVWGFNPDYLQGVYLGHLPVEEICFFVFVPYACFFVHACLKAYFPKLNVSRLGRIFAPLFSLLCLVLFVCFFDNLYTGVAALLALVLTLLFFYALKVQWYADFIFTFLVVQLPFFFVNGALTGMFTPQPIVWYNESEIMGPRWVSIPLEDTLYNYGFLILVFSLYYFFEKRAKMKHHRSKAEMRS